jgi:hypothetical protein
MESGRHTKTRSPRWLDTATNSFFPTYDGKDDPLPWLNRCGQFFRIQATKDAGKVFLTSFYMTGDAAQWYAFLEKNQGTPTSDEFEKLVNQRFGPPIHGNALGELIQLR